MNLLVALDHCLDVRLIFYITFRVRLDGRVEKWEDGKLWEDRKVGGWKIFSVPSCVFGWRGGKFFCLVGEKNGRMRHVIYIN